MFVRLPRSSVRLKQDKASTSRASFAMQGISFALENCEETSHCLLDSQ